MLVTVFSEITEPSDDDSDCTVVTSPDTCTVSVAWPNGISISTLRLSLMLILTLSRTVILKPGDFTVTE